MKEKEGKVSKKPLRMSTYFQTEECIGKKKKIYRAKNTAASLKKDRK